jgi:anaerobic ribonucleoside-triphosphate reductase
LQNLININVDIDELSKLEKYDEKLIELGFTKSEVNTIKELTNRELEKELLRSIRRFLITLKIIPTKNQSGIINLSIAYGTDTSEYGRMVTKNILIATQEGVSGHLYTTPVQIFKVKEGINYNKRDKNYDLYRLAVETQALRMYPNFMFLDATANQIEGINTFKRFIVWCNEKPNYVKRNRL